MYYLYRMRCTECNKFYIGITNNPKRRLKSHLSVEKLKWRDLTKFGRAVKRYGAKTFTMEIIQRTDDVEEIQRLESKWIKQLGLKRLWNSSITGGAYVGAAKRKKAYTRPVCDPKSEKKSDT